MSLVSVLEAGRRDFLEAGLDVPPALASVKPQAKGWSVLECIEHVIVTEERFLTWIATGTTIEPRRDTDKELRLFGIIRSRLTKVETPESFRPAGRYATLADALAGFEAIRDRTIAYIQEKGDALYSMCATHPFFGPVNGAEIVQLMDGHARRHADQIREIVEALRTTREDSMKPVAARKQTAFRRDPPDLPDEFEADGSLSAGELVTAHLQGADEPDLDVESLRIEGSVLERVQLAGGQFGSAVWKDVRLIGCDLANVRVHRMSLLRVEFIDCRLTGFRATALEWQDVLLRNCDVRYAQLQSGKFRSCEFDTCNWEDADLQNADLTGAVLRACKLRRADLQGATLRNTDFRTSEVEEMAVGMNDVRGAIVDPAQAMVFARLLGLQIR